MYEAMQNERDRALREVKHISKEFRFTAGLLKGLFDEYRMKQ
tara:strand:- start:180 stop:305 length:126 start_codon:yes stop_codon:yes gene_type:complete